MENDDVNNNTIYNTSSKKKDWLQMNKLLSTEGKYGEKIYGKHQTMELLFTITIKYVQSVCIYTVYVESRYT